jgi:hypothetical protein
MDPVKFVGSDICEHFARLVSERKHVAVVAPPGHGKSTLVATALEQLQTDCRVVVQRADPGAAWSRVRLHVENFANRCLLPSDSGSIKVFVLDDLDVVAACDKSCLCDLREILKACRLRLVVVFTCLPALVPKLARILTLVVRVDASPVPDRDLVEYGRSISQNHGLCDRAAALSRGSFPLCLSALRAPTHSDGSHAHSSLLLEGVDTTRQAVTSVLTNSPALDEMDRTLGSFGGHMFVDTVFHNASRVHNMQLTTYVQHAIRHVLMGSASHALNTLDRDTRDQINLARCAEWRGVAHTPEISKVEFTNTLALCNARAACRKKYAACACSEGMTIAEKVFADE